MTGQIISIKKKIKKNFEHSFVKQLTNKLFENVISELKLESLKKEKQLSELAIGEVRHSIIDIYRMDDADSITEIELPDNLYYLNNVNFSHDDRFVSICGKCGVHSWTTGFVGVYDLKTQKWVYGPETPNRAIWKSFFSTGNKYAYYNSIPNAMYGELLNGNLEVINGRSILTFSRSGKYIAMSDKGYIPFTVNTSNWGHMKSANIYVRKVGNEKELHFSDHGEEILGLYEKDVTCVSFSPDEKRLLSLSQDGVMVIRNLHLDVLETGDK